MYFFNEYFSQQRGVGWDLWSADLAISSERKSGFGPESNFMEKYALET